MQVLTSQASRDHEPVHGDAANSSRRAEMVHTWDTLYVHILLAIVVLYLFLSASPNHGVISSPVLTDGTSPLCAGITTP